jgi:hypothetical protein
MPQEGDTEICEASVVHCREKQFKCQLSGKIKVCFEQNPGCKLEAGGILQKNYSSKS